MIDVHDKLSGFGVMPEIFGVSTYSLCVGLGLIVGVLYLMWARRWQEAREHPAGQDGQSGQMEQAGQSEQVGQSGQTEPTGQRVQTSRNEQLDPALIIVASALVFGTIGTKIPTLLSGPTLADLLMEKSVIGGLLGGMAGVIIVKRVLHIRLRMGNIIAPAAALGLAIGRVGCFLNGCCYGIPASWGIDFGDGLLRLPTQLFEVAFQLTAFVLLHHFKDKVHTQGLLFKIYVSSYFLFRFFLEFIRVNPIYWQGLTLYQLLCLAGIVWMAVLMVRQKRVHPTREMEAPHE